MSVRLKTLDCEKQKELGEDARSRPRLPLLGFESSSGARRSEAAGTAVLHLLCTLKTNTDPPIL